MNFDNALNKLVTRYEPLIDDKEKFLASLHEFAPKTLRCNALKTTPERLLSKLKEYGISPEPLPFYDHGFKCTDTRLTNTLEFFQGHFYSQELASMLPPLLLFEEFKDDSRVSILDGSAAPGSKTTQLAELMQNQGVIIANDVNFQRIKALKSNLEKQGVANTITTNYDLHSYPEHQSFNHVLLDAPCSSEGTIRKNFKALKNWSESKINQMRVIQTRLLKKSFNLLEDEGCLVYSTCTIAPEENELVLQSLVDEFDSAQLESFEFEGLKHSKGVDEWRGNQVSKEVSDKVFRLWPHHNDTGAFFIAKIRKEE